MTTTFPAGPERPIVTLSPRTISTPVLSEGMVFGENLGGHRQRAHRYAAAREAKAAEAPPKRGQSEKPAAKRKRDERERNAASRTNEQVARTGSGRRVPVPEVKAGGRKFSAPTSPRPLENGLGEWQREKTPSGELDADERKKLNQRRRKAKTRAEERTQRQLSDDAPTAATAAADARGRSKRETHEPKRAVQQLEVQQPPVAENNNDDDDDDDGARVPHASPRQVDRTGGGDGRVGDDKDYRGEFSSWLPVIAHRQHETVIACRPTQMAHGQKVSLMKWNRPTT